MSKTAIKVLAALAAVVVALIGIRYNNQFKRISQVEIGSTPIQLGTINRVVFTNKTSSKIDFLLRCYVNTHEEGRIFPMEKMVLLPNESREFDVHPEFSPGNLPPMIANMTCTGIWQGPFGIERKAWRAHWQYGRPTAKVYL